MIWELSVPSILIIHFVFFSNRSLTGDRDLKLHLPSSQSENAIKLKTLTSPLTKFAANIGSALYGPKVHIPYYHSPYCIILLIPYLNSYCVFYAMQPVVNESASEMEKEKLLEKWEASKCKTKLIAL